MSDAPTAVSVAIKGNCVLLIRHGERGGLHRGADTADELTVEAAEIVARDIVAAITEIRRRKAG